MRESWFYMICGARVTIEPRESVQVLVQILVKVILHIEVHVSFCPRNFFPESES